MYKLRDSRTKPGAIHTDYVGGSEVALNKIMSEAVKASLIVVEITEDLK